MKKDGIKTKFPIAWLLLIIVFSLIAFFIAFDFPEQRSDARDEYRIDAYSVEATVHGDNSLSIVETIDAYFMTPSHGIYRYIPLYEDVMFQENGTTYNKHYKVNISGVSCSHSFYHELNASTYIMQIGDEHRIITGPEQYVISYRIYLGDDKLTAFDQLYYNFIGTEWDTTISNVSIDISFDKDVPGQPIYFYVKDQTINSAIENSRVHFEYAGTLPAFSGITARTTLQEGYFVTTKQSHTPDYVMLGVAIAALIVAIILYAVSNKNKIITIVEFSNPKGITPTDAGYIIDRITDTGEVGALIVYWASKGYLAIKEEDKSVTLFKLQNADGGMKDYEKDIFNALFSNGDMFKLEDKNEKLAKAVLSAKAKVKKENEKFFSKKNTSIKTSLLAIFAILFTINIFVLIRQVAIQPLSIIVYVMLALVTFFALSMVMYAQDRKQTMSKTSLVLSYIIGLAIVLALTIVSAIFLTDSYSTPTYNAIVVPLILSPLIFFALKLDTRVEGPEKEVGRVLGLRQFILVAEKDRLKAMSDENPQLFYDVLPYAYVLGLGGIWVDKFKEIEIAIPEWYVGDPDLISTYIGIRLFSSMTAFNTTVTRSLPKGSNGSGPSGGGISFGGGGGFSGGGFGGGGGGRW